MTAYHESIKKNLIRENLPVSVINLNLKET